MTAYTLVIEGKPFTSNDERRSHWTTTRKTRKEARRHAWLLALNEIPAGTRWQWPVTVSIVDECSTANLRDTAACAPHAKAIIDGITDSRRAWPDDTAEYIAAIIYRRPTKTGRDALVVTITDEDHI